MPSAGYTEQGRRVADHWSRLAASYDGILRALEERGIAADKVSVDDLHAADMLHMGGLAATDELGALASIAKGKTKHRRYDWAGQNARSHLVCGR